MNPRARHVVRTLLVFTVIAAVLNGIVWLVLGANRPARTEWEFREQERVQSLERAEQARAQLGRAREERARDFVEWTRTAPRVSEFADDCARAYSGDILRYCHAMGGGDASSMNCELLLDQRTTAKRYRDAHCPEISDPQVLAAFRSQARRYLSESQAGQE
ncbi:MAG: hypothetical protein QNJ82_16780 [Gammaproteobacteria bacterium]|nr:hypothetical protein [Gammaproteobacteria bacterium]